MGSNLGGHIGLGEVEVVSLANLGVAMAEVLSHTAIGVPAKTSMDA